jgi:hypothetical protein
VRITGSFSASIVKYAALSVTTLLLGCTCAFADTLKCISHYESFKNKVKFADNPSYVEVLNYEKNKEQTIKSVINGKPVSQVVFQDTIDGQTNQYSNINNHLIKHEVSIGASELRSAYYEQEIKPQLSGQMSKVIHTSELIVNLESGEMTRSSSVQTQRERFDTNSSGHCMPLN